MAIDFPNDCVVCRKHRGLVKVPGGAIFENESLFVSHAQLWREETAHYLGHIFIEPKRHVPELSQLLPKEAREIGACMPRVAKAIEKVCGAEHVYAFVIGDGVPHFHVHMIGRYPGAPRQYWGPKVDEWPDGPRGGEQQIADLAQGLRTFLVNDHRRDA